MKNFFLFKFVFVLGLISITSCNNEELPSDYSSSTMTNDMKDVISIDSLFSIGNEKFISWESGTDSSQLTRSSVTPFTNYGYSSYTSTGNKKVLIGKDMANKFGVSNQVYITEVLTVYQRIYISGLNTSTYFIYADSPNCGTSPNNSSEIGYSFSQEGETVVLVTKIYHLISDTNGVSYDKWYPRRPAELQWNYKLILL